MPEPTTKSKLDLFKMYKAEYATPKKPIIVNCSKACYLSYTGQGEPGGDDYIAGVGALYAMAYTLKFTRKAEGNDYTVCKLETIWWGKNQNREFASDPKDTWNWKLLIRTPDFIKSKDLLKASDTLISKGKPGNVADVKIERIGEGKCVQMLHVGPYEQEGETVALMQEFADQNGLAFSGPHHDIYLSDPRRVAPEKLKTILRVPVKPA